MGCNPANDGKYVCSYIEKGIDLSNVPRNDSTKILFDAAQKSGSSDVLSEDDSYSYAMYQMIACRIMEGNGEKQIKYQAKKFMKDAKKLLTSMKVKIQEVERSYSISGKSKRHDFY